jgi:hypothetical protein
MTEITKLATSVDSGYGNKKEKNKDPADTSTTTTIKLFIPKQVGLG